MAGRITLNRADNSHRPPNTGDGTEFGDSYDATLANLNTMFTEIYGARGAAVQVGGAVGTTGKSVLMLKTNVTAFSSANTNTSQTMFSYTLPASVLGSTGDGIFVETWGTTANNAASKSIILNIGGASVGTASFTSAAEPWALDAYVFKTGNNAQSLFLESWHGTVRTSTKRSTDTSVDTGTIAITVVATDASAASANVLGDALIVEFLPNN